MKFVNWFVELGLTFGLVTIFDSLKKHKIAHKVFKKHWNKDNTAIQTQRSNIGAEQAFKIMQDMQCKSAEKINLKFILLNYWLHYINY